MNDKRKGTEFADSRESNETPGLIASALVANRSFETAISSSLFSDLCSMLSFESLTCS